MRPMSASFVAPDVKRRSFTEPVSVLGRSRSRKEKGEKAERRRSKSRVRERDARASDDDVRGGGGRSRAGSFDERSTVVRENMPHRRDKGKAWWEGAKSPAPGERSPRRSSMRM